MEDAFAAWRLENPGNAGWPLDAFKAGWVARGELPDEPIVERLAYEASQWAKDPAHNPGADQPSLVFARRFAFLWQKRP